jgi:hypothetical protein
MAKKLGSIRLVKINVLSSEIIYNAKMISCLLNIFDTSAQMEALKTLASEQAEEQLKQSQQKLNEILKNQKSIILDIKVAAPLIVLPFDQDEMITSECWVLSPGILKILGDNFNEDLPRRRKTDEGNHYDNFKIALENIKVEYMPSVMDYMEKYTRDAFKNPKNKMLLNLYEHKSKLIGKTAKIASFPQFDVLKDFYITIGLNVLKPAFVQLSFEEPQFKVSAVISKMQLDLNKKIYSDLMKIGDIFQDEGTGGSQLQTEKKGLLASNSKYGILLRGNQLNGFSTVEFGILSQGRLYFFKDSKAQAAYDYHSLKNSSVKALTVEESGHPLRLEDHQWQVRDEPGLRKRAEPDELAGGIAERMQEDPGHKEEGPRGGGGDRWTHRTS